MAGKTFVLVHGAWGGSEGWTAFADRLRGQGHRVFTPCLTGLGARRHLFSGDVNLSTHIQDVVGTFESEELHEVCLLGHSYGGMVITGVADRLAARISHLVYLDAFLPEDGQSGFDFIGEEGTIANVRAAGDCGGVGVPPPPLARFKVSPAVLARLEKHISPHPIGCFSEKLKLTGAGAAIRKRLYIWAAGYRPSIFEKAYAKTSQDPAWQTDTVPCGHIVQAEEPERLAEILTGFI
jgi:pimeloyl-ACP methyl ester carboxylesterase